MSDKPERPLSEWSRHELLAKGPYFPDDIWAELCARAKPHKSQTTKSERREYFSRSDIEDLMKRELPVYRPDACVEWESDGSAVVIWVDDEGKSHD